MESALIQMNPFVSKITCHRGCYQTRFSQRGGKHRSEHLSWRMTNNAPPHTHTLSRHTDTRMRTNTHRRRITAYLEGRRITCPVLGSSFFCQSL